MNAKEVIVVINGPICKLATPVEADTPLLSSGLLDSLALFNLTLWIEEEIGRMLDIFNLDIKEQWETPAQIAAYIERERRRQAG